HSAQLGVERICHMVDIAATQPGIIQTETDRMLGKLVRVVDLRLLTVFDAVEPLLLAGDDEHAVDDQRGGGLVIHRVNAENVNRPTRRRGSLPSLGSKDRTEHTRNSRRRASKLNIKHFDTDATFCECFINCLEDYVFAHLTVDFLAICTDEKQRMPVNLC